MTYREVILYCQSKLAYNNDRLREQIILDEAISNKMLQANPLLNKYPKIISLKECFSRLFKEDEIF